MELEELERIGEYTARLRRSAGLTLVLDPEERKDLRELLQKWCDENERPAEVKRHEWERMRIFLLSVGQIKRCILCHAHRIGKLGPRDDEECPGEPQFPWNVIGR